MTAVDTSASDQAARFADGMQIDRRAVEAQAPAEDGQHEGRADHPPSVEFRHAPSLAVNVPRGNAQRYGRSRSVIPSCSPEIGLELPGDLAKIAKSAADGTRLFA